MAVRLAPAHNKREAMEEWLYAHQPAMTPPSVRQAARDIAQITDFEASIPGRRSSLVKSDVALGRQLNVKSTPTFFINGVRIEGGSAAAVFRSGDRDRAAARRRIEMTGPVRLAWTLRLRAIAHELTKDYRRRLLAQAVLPARSTA